FRHSASQDDVFNFLCIELRHSLQRTLDRERGQLIGSGGTECAFESASNRCANRRCDYDFSHESNSIFSLTTSLPASLTFRSAPDDSGRGETSSVRFLRRSPSSSVQDGRRPFPSRRP